MESGLVVLDRMLEEESGRSGGIASVAFLRRARDQAGRLLAMGAAAAPAAVYVPVGIWGLFEGFGTPDLDISLLGIGKHRYFLFHSALGLVVLRHLYRLWTEKEASTDTGRVVRKMAGAALGGLAVGVGVHLAVDVFQPKSVQFPFFGSLADGTLIDDNIWLLGNSFWAFRVAHDVFALTFASELETAKADALEKFGHLAVRP